MESQRRTACERARERDTMDNENKTAAEPAANADVVDIEKDRMVFVSALTETRRPGMDKVVAALGSLGFFEAPASSKFHLSVRGGLLRHSINVWRQARQVADAQVAMDPSLAKRLPDDSIRIAALLHDVCKSDVYKSEKRNRRNERGAWEQYDAYVADYERIPLGHGEKSVIMLLRLGLELTMDEILAIRWHMANWDMSDSMEARSSFSAACAKCPLLSVIIAADELATRITEC